MVGRRGGGLADWAGKVVGRLSDGQTGWCVDGVWCG